MAINALGSVALASIIVSRNVGGSVIPNPGATRGRVDSAQPIGFSRVRNIQANLFTRKLAIWLNRGRCFPRDTLGWPIKTGDQCQREC